MPIAGYSFFRELPSDIDKVCGHHWEGGVGRGILPTKWVCMRLCVSFVESLLDWIWGREWLVPRSSARP